MLLAQEAWAWLLRLKLADTTPEEVSPDCAREREEESRRHMEANTYKVRRANSPLLSTCTFPLILLFSPSNDSCRPSYPVTQNVSSSSDVPTLKHCMLASVGKWANGGPVVYAWGYSTRRDYRVRILGVPSRKAEKWAPLNRSILPKLVPWELSGWL